MSQLQNGGVINHGEQRSDEEEENDVLAEDFEAAYSRAQREFTREVRRKHMLWLIRGLIFGAFVTVAIGLPIAFLTAPSDTNPGSNSSETSSTSTSSLETTEISTTERPTTGTNGMATTEQDGGSTMSFETINPTTSPCNPDSSSVQIHREVDQEKSTYAWSWTTMDLREFYQFT